MLPFLLDLLAPRARASLDINSRLAFPEVLDDLKATHELKDQKPSLAKFRVDGDFFSHGKATQVLIGKKADPKHYSKVGFNLTVIDQGDRVVFLAEERVILGYLETKAVGEALQYKLNGLAQAYI